MTDPIQVALQVAEALETCGLRYLVGGSLASSISGEPRYLRRRPSFSASAICSNERSEL